MENKIFYSIKEVSALVKEPESTLRYWQSKFGEEIKPTRDNYNVRSYSESDIDNIRLIQYFIRDCGLTLEGVQKRLKNNKEINERLAKAVLKLKNIKAELKALGKMMDEVAP